MIDRLIGGRYAPERELGRGGMGAVWLGRDEVLGRPVALKRVGLLPGVDSPDRTRAEREARIAASLSHPHVVGIYDFLVTDGEQWLVMEYFEGTNLGDLIRTTGRFTPDRVVPILRQVASALDAAHRAGVVHRDVKPSNILVGEDGVAKLTDFGIARAATDEALTQTGLVTGSPAYLAPEVASGQQAGPEADVWSFGATVFHALAGHPPYQVNENVLGALYRIVNEPPPRLPEDQTGPLGRLLEATMARHPQSRWSMADVVAYLDQVDRRPFANGGGPPRAEAEVAAAPPPATVRGSQDVATAATAVVPRAPGPTRSRRSRPRRRGVLPLLVSMVVVLLVATIVILAMTDDPQDIGTGAQPGPSTSSGSTSPDGGDGSSTELPSAAAMRQFVRDYIALASTDPAAAFEQLTRAYQRSSGGLSGYEQFWGSVTDATILRVDADPAASTVSYTYRYTRRGEPARTEPVTLRLVRRDSGFLIAEQL